MAGVFLAAFSYVAALMGAGFASGQEVATFFVVFGKWGMVGILLSAALIGLFGGLVSEYAMQKKMNYGEIILEVAEGKIARLLNILTLVYSVAVISVMLACFGELGRILFGLPKFTGAVFLSVFCGFLLIKNNKTTLCFNGIAGVVIFILCAAVCLFLLGYREHQTFNNTAVGAGVSGGVYAGYNLINVGSVLANGRVFLKKRGDGILCGTVTAVMIFVLLTLMWGILGIYYGKIDLGEIPMLTLTMRESAGLSWIYALVIAVAVITTAFSGGMCAVELTETKNGKVKSVVAVMGIGLALSGAGFSGLINTLYRYCGYAGIIAVAFVGFSIFKKMSGGIKDR